MNYKEKPFYLDDVDIAWVENTLENMSLEEMIGQLFCPIGYSTDPEYLNMLLHFHIGGLFSGMVWQKRCKVHLPMRRSTQRFRF